MVGVQGRIVEIKDIAQVVTRGGDRPITLAVIGDLCLDLAYQVTTEQAEISVETGLQTFSVLSSKPELGGACNVAVNCKMLGAEKVDIYGIIGDDFFGDLLLSLLDKQGIGTGGISRQQHNWATHVYHKVFEQGVEHPRFDSGNFNDPDDASIDRLIATLSEKLTHYDAIIINEQVPRGLHNTTFQQRLNHLINHGSHAKDPIWFADCRKLNNVYRNTIHKLNEQEGQTLYGPTCTLSREALAQWLAKHFDHPVVLTLGPDGAIAVEPDKPVANILGIHFSGQVDAVGAGDAFLAGMVVARCRGASMAEAAYFGNLSAGVSLTVLYGCGHPTFEEVVELSRKVDWRYHPQIADDSRLATYWQDTPLEIIVSREKTALPSVAIFDHDGTISTLRQGWEAVMEESMLSAIAGDALDSLRVPELEKLRAEVQAFIDRTTGIQTIEQMHYLVDLVRRYGYIDSSQVLTAVEYKQRYNERLLEMVDRKIDEFQAGRLDVTDVTMKGAVDFLCRLSEHGTELYLASGTDVDDVRREAELLGYAEYFSGRIYGSVGDMANDPKRLVIQQIIEEQLAGHTSSCAVFGDGPVEMREAKRHGLLAIGVLSDEVRRYGVNMSKRKRLILGGADLLIPDFSHASTLAAYCGWKEIQ